MKKITLTSLFLVLISTFSIAATGWFNDFLTINVNGTVAPNNYYIGTDPTSGALAIQGKAFGLVTALEITGADMKYWSDTQDRTGAAFYYKITNTTNTFDFVAATEIIMDQVALGGNDFQGTKTTTINLLTGLPAGSYQLHVWAKSWGTGQGDSWLSNNSANYVATFMKAPTSTAPMSGTYKIGNANDANFNLLSAAVTALNSYGIGGDVILEIASDITETVNIGLINNSNFSITIRPDLDVDRTITFNKIVDNTGPSGAFCLGIGMGLAWTDLSPTKNITIDGYAVGGATKRLKIATAITHHGGNGPFLLIDDCSNIKIKNCIIQHVGASTGSSNYGIYLRVNTAYGTKKMPSNVTIENNTITNTQNSASQAIAIYSNAAPTTNANTIIIKNNIINARTRGLFVYYLDGLDVIGNEFHINQANDGSLSSAIMGNAGLTGNINVFGNKFIELKSGNKTATYGMRAIIASGGGNWYIKNNFFTGFDKTSATAGETMMQGIRCGSTCYIWHNTFLLNPLTNKPTTHIETPTDAQSAYCAINIAAGTPEIKNNIFISNEDGFFNFLIRGGVSGVTDYNVYYLRAGNTKARINMNFTTPYATFSAYRADNALMDINSKNVDVNFLSTTDLSISGASIQDANLKVPSLAAVTTDIFGTVRNTGFTYAGAHESTLPFLSTEVENGTIEQVRIIRTTSGIEVQLNQESKIELFTINGVLIHKANINGTYSLDLNSGVYIIRINGKATKFIK